MKLHPPLETSILYNFVIIAESSSLTDAAQRLGVSQPAVSQSLKQMEETLGAELVVRRSNPIKLTPAGIVLKQNADVILGELRQLRFAVREAANKGAAHCRIGAITSYSEVFGSQFIISLQQKTDLLTLQSGSTPLLKKAFLNHDLDILISDELLQKEDGLEQFKIFKDPLVIIAKPGLVKTAQRSITALVEQAPMIKYNRNNNIGVLVEIALRRMDISPSVRFSTDDTHTLINFVNNNHGWAITSSLCLLQAKHQLNNIEVLPLDKSQHARTLYLIARKNELGLLPENMANTAKTLFKHDVYPTLKQFCPWLKPELFL